MLLPRFGLKADPDYDPTEDWLDDNKGLPYMVGPAVHGTAVRRAHEHVYGCLVCCRSRAQAFALLLQAAAVRKCHSVARCTHVVCRARAHLPPASKQTGVIGFADAIGDRHRDAARHSIVQTWVHCGEGKGSHEVVAAPAAASRHGPARPPTLPCFPSPILQCLPLPTPSGVSQLLRRALRAGRHVRIE